MLDCIRCAFRNDCQSLLVNCLVFKLELRGYLEVQNSRDTPLLLKQFFRQRVGPVDSNLDETVHWVIAWHEPRLE